jgi:hypothetical protein
MYVYIYILYISIYDNLDNDWKKVHTLYERYPDFIVPSFGLHPWWISRYLNTDIRVTDIPATDNLLKDIPIEGVKDIWITGIPATDIRVTDNRVTDNTVKDTWVTYKSDNIEPIINDQKNLDQKLRNIFTDIEKKIPQPGSGTGLGGRVVGSISVEDEREAGSESGSGPGLGGRVVGSISVDDEQEVPLPGSGGRVVGSISMDVYKGIEVENKGSGDVSLKVVGLDSSGGLGRERWELELDEMLMLIPAAGVGKHVYVYLFVCFKVISKYILQSI